MFEQNGFKPRKLYKQICTGQRGFNMKILKVHTKWGLNLRKNQLGKIKKVQKTVNFKVVITQEIFTRIVSNQRILISIW